MSCWRSWRPKHDPGAGRDDFAGVNNDYDAAGVRGVPPHCLLGCEIENAMMALEHSNVTL